MEVQVSIDRKWWFSDYPLHKKENLVKDCMREMNDASFENFGHGETSSKVSGL